jgi:hypothetical protein
MYSPSFIASEVTSAQEALAAGRYDIAERKFSGVTSFISFNLAVGKASAGDTTGAITHATCRSSRASFTRETPGAIDQLSHITDGHILPLILRGVCFSQVTESAPNDLSFDMVYENFALRIPLHRSSDPPCSHQTPGEGHVEAAANDFENALIMCGQLMQAELDAWLCPIRQSVVVLTVEVVREETKIKMALMQVSKRAPFGFCIEMKSSFHSEQARVSKQRLQTGRPTMSFHQSSAAEQQHPKVFVVPVFSFDSIFHFSAIISITTISAI